MGIFDQIQEVFFRVSLRNSAGINVRTVSPLQALDFNSPPQSPFRIQENVTLLLEARPEKPLAGIIKPLHLSEVNVLCVKSE
jgi:hypothetical protein